MGVDLSRVRPMTWSYLFWIFGLPKHLTGGERGGRWGGGGGAGGVGGGGGGGGGVGHVEPFFAL